MNQSRNEKIAHTQGLVHRRVWLAWGILVAAIILTTLVTLYMKTDVDVQAKREFMFACNEIRSKIGDRLQAHEMILLAGAAVFDASDKVTREEWRNFTQRLNVESNLPGIQGIGFALRIPPDCLTQHVQEIRSEGFPNYNVRPEGDRNVYSSIIYLEPFLGRNLRAFGYDMLSEPLRRAAMERARDQNEAALSGKVILVEETEEDIQAGALMYVPVYRRGMPTQTVEQRSEALIGWVYSPYRMTDLMRGTLGGWDSQEGLRIRLQVYDGTRLSPDTILYDSQTANDMKFTPQFTEERQVIFNGSPWTLRFIQVGGQVSLVGSAKVWFTLAGGMIISLLLFGLTLSLLNSRSNAKQMADRLTTELRESEDHLRSLVEHLPQRIFLKDRNSVYLTCNENYASDLGITPEQIVGRDDLAFHPPELAQAYRADDQACMATGMVKDVQESYNVGGQERWIHTIKVPYHDRQGQVIGVLGIFEDITDRKRMEEERQAMERRLLNAQKFESLAVMAGGIAHDFNNQLAVVLGNLEIALTDQTLDTETRLGIESAVEAAKISAELSHQMRTYAGNTLYYPVALDLNEFLNRNSSLLKLCVSNYVRLNMESHITLPPMKGDTDQIQRLVINILVNASEAIGAVDGEVTIRTGVMDCDAAYLGRSRLEDKPESGRFVFLEVTDTGCGMGTETLRRLFDPFFTTKFTGRGLGMAEVIGTVKGHHGAIMVDSEAGKGTTVRVLFPASEKTQASSARVMDVVAPKSSSSDSVPGRKTILVVEDEARVRSLVVRSLKLLGYDSITAVDGVEGVSVFRERSNEIDLVMLDFKMPKMDGVEAFEELIQIRPDVKVILSSGYTEDDVIERFSGPLPAGILHKPYDIDILEAELRRLLGTTY